MNHKFLVTSKACKTVVRNLEELDEHICECLREAAMSCSLDLSNLIIERISAEDLIRHLSAEYSYIDFIIPETLA